jgi:hypothetical protein
MAGNISQRVLQRVQSHAFEHLSFAQRETTNLHIDMRTYEKGETIGPEFQRIVAPQSSILVFADDEPRANFGHTCRYLLYENKTGEFVQETRARFPPVADAKQTRMLKPFHEPVRLIENPNLFRPFKPIWRCPIIVPEGTRYAILFSGMTNKRHLNDMEFLYRTLVDVYAFNPAHIYVLNYDNSLNTQDGVQAHWPGDGSAYRIQVTGEGNQAGFEAAIDDLKGKLHRLDTVLIHCNNHGDSDTPDGGITWIPNTAYLCTYPNWGNYYHTDFSNKLAELPKFRQLIVMLEQCHSGGFNASILTNSPADATSVASAATEFQDSYITADGNWDPFARDWIAAQTGHDPFGGALTYNPDTNGDGKIQAEEAFQYALTVQDPRDSPNFSESSQAGGDIILGQEYRIWWWWCRILYYELEKYHIKLPPPEYYERLHKIEPELTKLTAELDKTSEALRKEMQVRVEALVKEAFEGQRGERRRG